MNEEDRQTIQAVGESRRQIAASLEKGRKAITPRAQREAAIDYLIGVSILVRELGGAEFTGIAADLVGALDDLNQGRPNLLFAYRRQGRKGRHLKSLGRDVYMAYACAAVDIKKAPHGERKRRIAEVARRFKIRVSALISFRKKLTSNANPSPTARMIYDELCEEFRETNMTWREIVDVLAMSAAGCFPK